MILLNENSKMREYLEKSGTPHVVEYTNSSTTIKVWGEKYLISPNDLKKKDLGFIGRVKKDVSVKEIEEQKSPRPFYYEYGKILNGTYKNKVEVDVNGAYWALAYKLGYLSEKVYKEGLLVPKHVRLVAWGSIATYKQVYEFNGKEYEEREPICNERTRSYFFHVAHELGVFMSKIFNENRDKILLYWVDAFFCENEKSLVDEINLQSEKNQLSCKIKEVEEIEVFRISPFTQQINVLMKGKKVPKPFLKKEKTDNPLYLEMKLNEFLKEVEGVKV